MADRYLLESGSPDGYLLEDGTGVLLIDEAIVEINLAFIDQTYTIFGITATHVDIPIALIDQSAVVFGVGPATDAYSLVVLQDDPVLYWRMGEPSGPLKDSSGSGLHSTNTQGSPTYGAADVIASGDGAITYGVASAHTIQNGNNPDIDLVNWYAELDFAADLWFRGTNTGAGLIQMLTGKYNGWGTQAGWKIGFDATDNLVVRIGTTTDVLSVAGAGYLDGQPHHLAVVRECTEPRITLYIDGVEVATSTNATIDDNFAQTQNFHASNNASVDGFVGTIDELAVYRHTLTPTQITEHWDAGKPTGQDVNIALIDQSYAIFAVVTDVDIPIALIDLSAQLFSVDAAANIDLALIDQTYAIFAVTTDATVDLGFIDLSAQMFAVSVSHDIAIGLIDQSYQIFAVSAEVSANASFIDQTYQIFGVTVDHDVALGLIDQSYVIFAVSIVESQAVEPGFIDQSYTMFNVSISVGDHPNVLLAFIDQTYQIGAFSTEVPPTITLYDFIEWYQNLDLCDNKSHFHYPHTHERVPGGQFYVPVIPDDWTPSDDELVDAME